MIEGREARGCWRRASRGAHPSGAVVILSEATRRVAKSKDLRARVDLDADCAHQHMSLTARSGGSRPRRIGTRALKRAQTADPPLAAPPYLAAVLSTPCSVSSRAGRRRGALCCHPERSGLQGREVEGSPSSCRPRRLHRTAINRASCRGPGRSHATASSRRSEPA